MNHSKSAFSVFFLLPRFLGAPTCRRVLILAISIGFWARIPDLSAKSNSNLSVFGVFVGSSPFGETMKSLLQIPPAARADLMQWNLTLYQDARTLAPTTYKLHCEFGPAVPGLPGLGATRTAVDREGSWRKGTGIKSNPEAVVYDLNGTVSLFKLTPDIVHVLDRDRSLMIGTSGWSYTLQRVEATEKPGDPAQTGGTDHNESGTVSPLATGPSVFGVFDGRSPCQSAARELKIDVSGSCFKLKWRITLYQDPKTQAPTTYKMEDSLHRRKAREGTWSIIRGAETDPNAIVYRLAPTKTEGALLLLKGDENVLFFLNQHGKPLVGNAGFSYTLHRTVASSEPQRSSTRTVPKAQP